MLHFFDGSNNNYTNNNTNNLIEESLDSYNFLNINHEEYPHNFFNSLANLTPDSENNEEFVESDYFYNQYDVIKPDYSLEDSLLFEPKRLQTANVDPIMNEAFIPNDHIHLNLKFGNYPLIQPHMSHSHTHPPPVPQLQHRHSTNSSQFLISSNFDKYYELMTNEDDNKRSQSYNPNINQFHGLQSVNSSSSISSINSLPNKLPLLKPTFESYLKEYIKDDDYKLSKSVNCNHCETSFNNILKYCKHLDEFKLTTPYQCADKTCPFHKVGFMKKIDLRVHITQVHLQIYNNSSIQEKMKLIEKNPQVYEFFMNYTYVCPNESCKRIFYRKDTLNRHVKLVHAANNANIFTNYDLDKKTDKKLEDKKGITKKRASGSQEKKWKKKLKNDYFP